MQRPKFILNLLVLTTVIGLVLTGWLAGHILRFSIPAYYHQQPPNPEVNPKIKIGYEFEFEGEPFVVVSPEGNPLVQVFLSEGQMIPLERCLGATYYTSLPAKCHTADGKLVRVGVQGVQLIYLEEK